MNCELINRQQLMNSIADGDTAGLKAGFDCKQQLRCCIRLTALVLLGTGMALAQATSVGRAATGISNEAVTITRAIGIIILIVGGFAAAFSEGHGRAGVVGMVFGLLIAFGAPTIATWLQSF